MAKVVVKKKITFGKRKLGKSKKHVNKHESLKAYNSQGK
jgi:hypothetical protein